MIRTLKRYPLNLVNSHRTPYIYIYIYICTEAYLRMKKKLAIVQCGAALPGPKP